MLSRLAIIPAVLFSLAVHLSAEVSGQARLRLRVHQPGLADPVAVRAVIVGSNGEIVPGEWNDSDWPPVAIRGKAVTPEMVLDLPTGPTKLILSKGPDYLPLLLETNLASANTTYTVEATFRPVFDLYQNGWRSGDAHIHFFHGDNQVSRTPEEAYAICAAGGLNFASFAGEHFGASLLTEAESHRVWRPYEATDCKIWLGAESPKNAWGHHASLLYDPWKVRDALPYHLGIHSVHQQGGVCFPVHPMRTFPFREFGGDYSLYPLNNHYKFLPIAALAGHLLDGWSGVSDEPGSRWVLEPYFSLLQLGYKIPLLADSDFCMDRANNGIKGAGFFINYFHLEGLELTPAAVCRAIRKGRVMSTSGPLVLFTIDDAISGDILPADGVPRTVRIKASHAFNPWTLSSNTFNQSADCKIESIALYRNGVLLETWNPDAPNAEVSLTVSETEDASYMVRVLGNEKEWMAGYASPIYFARTADISRKPEVFKLLVNGRLYDAATGQSITGLVSSVRYGRTDWTISTDAEGRFRARVPIDAELVARDGQGRQLARELLNHEPAYSFCHYLPERFTNRGPAIEAFRELVREVSWEFPVGLQLADSYVRQELEGDFTIEDLIVLGAPERLPAKNHSEIVMLFVDKTEVQPGDRLNFSLLVRAPASGEINDQIDLYCAAWDPRTPRMYTRYGTLLEPALRSAPLDVGGGFSLLNRSVEIPAWATNVGPFNAGLRISATVWRDGVLLEDASLTLKIGATRRALLVSTTWDGLPAGWGERGHGPCDFFRESYKVRYPDYRQLEVRVTDGGWQRVRIEPARDTANAPDADDAIFTDQHYYDAQCEPEYRNVPFRDPIRAQPPAVDFSAVEIHDPPDSTAPEIALMEPLPNAEVTSPVPVYYHVEDAGLSGAGPATLFIDGQAVVTGTIANPILVDLEPGEYTWQIGALDRAGNSARSESRVMRVRPRGTNPPPTFLESTHRQNLVELTFSATPGEIYLLEQTSSLFDWRLVLRTNAHLPALTIRQSLSTNPLTIYRLRQR